MNSIFNTICHRLFWSLVTHDFIKPNRWELDECVKMSPLENQTGYLNQERGTFCHVNSFNSRDLDQYRRLPVKNSHAVLHRQAGKNTSGVVWYRFVSCKQLHYDKLTEKMFSLSDKRLQGFWQHCPYRFVNVTREPGGC